MEQKALIVVYERFDQSLNYLNELLESKQWKVVDTCPMPSSSACTAAGKVNHVTKILPTCLVIVERIIAETNENKTFPS